MKQDSPFDVFAESFAHQIALAVVVVISLVLCFVPLFNVFGYESAAATGFVAAILTIFLTLYGTKLGVSPLLERDSSPVTDLLKNWVTHSLFVVVPAAIFLLNGIRVQTCGYLDAALFWLAIPVVSVGIGQLIGWLSLIIGGSRLTRWGTAGGLILLTFVPPAYMLALEPPIIAHHALLGYFSGSIYDEGLAFPASLAWYRLMHLSAIGVFLSLIDAAWRLFNSGRWRWSLISAAIFALPVVAIVTYDAELGIARDSDYVAEALGGKIETEHFVIHHPDNEWFSQRKDEVAEDHEFRYRQMKAFFETDPSADGRIHSYIYKGSSQKAKLMGGRHTHVAKIWLDQMHLEWSDYGDHMLAHELAHIFTGPFGTGPLSLSMSYGIFPNMGLVEGIAVAADWAPERLSPHRVTAGLIEQDYIEEPKDLIGAGGFWSRLSGQSYRVMGSFIKYLIDEYGIGPFKAIYGQASFEKAYGKPLKSLISEWGAFLDGIQLSDSERAYVDYRFDRPTIFEKVCPRTIGELRRRAHRAVSRGSSGETRRLYEQILEYAPRNISYRVEYARSLQRLREFNAADEMIEDLLSRGLKVRQRVVLLELKGDLAWQKQQLERAREAYEQCTSVEGLPNGKRRLMTVKKAALDEDRRVRDWMRAYLVDEYAKGPKVYYPMAWYDIEPKLGLSNYLVGRQLWAHDNWTEAVPYLRRARERLEGYPLLIAETRRMLVETLYFLGKLDKAAEQAQTLSQTERSAYATRAREWLERIQWKRTLN